MYYKLENKIPVPCSLKEWAGQYSGNKNKDRFLQQDKFQIQEGGLDQEVFVSTVFLGLDHRFAEEGPPILFETMIFGGKHDQYQERYSTWEEAISGHDKALKLAKGL